MYVTEHLSRAQSAGKVALSLEVLPPVRGDRIGSLFSVLDKLVDFKPSFINVTYHHQEIIRSFDAHGYPIARMVRKRPGTVGICAAIQNRFRIDTVAHIIAAQHTKQTIEDILLDLHYLGIDNVLALRGDNAKEVVKPPSGQAANAHQIKGTTVTSSDTFHSNKAEASNGEEKGRKNDKQPKPTAKPTGKSPRATKASMDRDRPQNRLDNTPLDNIDTPAHFPLDTHAHAKGLVEQVAGLNRGSMLDQQMDKIAFSTDFQIGVAGYPEKHVEAPSLDRDIFYLKKKVDAGASYVVTQMFFDNQHYYDFCGAAKVAGINCPIIPGLKPITSLTQLKRIPSFFHCAIPQPLADAISGIKSGDKESIRQIGIEWTVAQARDLIASGVPCLHFYTMSKDKTIGEILKHLF